MKDPMQYLDRLAMSARKEIAPDGDVSSKVIARIRKSRPTLARPMLFFATGYATVTALLAVIYGTAILESVRDPLSFLFQMAAEISF